MMKISIQTILKKIDHLSYEGSEDLVINEIKSLDQNIEPNSVFWSSDKFLSKAIHLECGLAIVSKKSAEEYLKKKNRPNLLIVEKPRQAFQALLSEFFAPKPQFGVIDSSAVISPLCSYNITQVHIGANVVIEDNVSLGKNVSIDHNSVIKSGTIIHNNVLIGANSTIGGGGFGYEKNEDGQNVLIPHIGFVEIKSNVEIGNNVCIDRGVLGATRIHENVKIDNLVHIAHGVEIGKNSLIIANSMIAGSVKIGENVWVSPSASIIQKSTIGNNSLIGMGSVVLKDVEDSTVVAGVPAKKIKTL